LSYPIPERTLSGKANNQTLPTPSLIDTDHISHHSNHDDPYSHFSFSELIFLYGDRFHLILFDKLT
jgi:hypothetical protein